VGFKSVKPRKIPAAWLSSLRNMCPFRCAIAVVLILLVFPLFPALAADSTVEEWGTYEISLPGPSDGNPFVDVGLSATFSDGTDNLEISGFYDGGGIYRIRFMPANQGHWTYQTHSNRPELDGKTGEFDCTPPSPGDHGPVRVANIYHFAYADGTPYWEIGTTCYGWSQAPDDLVNQTLATLKTSPFNKIRMQLTPKKHLDGLDLEVQFPYVRGTDGKFDYTRFNPAFFQRQEKHIQALRDIGVEADLILFQPYDSEHLGFKNMGAENDELYLKYVIARFGAYRNIWWSLANEYDHIHSKTESDWDRLFQIVQDNDPYGHLRSIHNGAFFYDANKPWVTHMSVQNGSAVADFGRASLYRNLVRKPICYDEIKYEGNIEPRWGQLTPEQMTLEFWMATIGGTYATHGETYSTKKGESSWTPMGGILRGQSPARIAFLKSILQTAPATGIEPIDQYDEDNVGGKAGEYYLIYFGETTPSEWDFKLFREKVLAGMTFHVDVIDTWNMTIQPVDRVFKAVKDNSYFFKADGDGKIPLPGRPYMALRIIRLSAPTTAPAAVPATQPEEP
jgi:uncharacterized protein DUF5060/uncharacterized protein DUF5605/uncharacterized protein DUF4038